MFAYSRILLSVTLTMCAVGLTPTALVLIQLTRINPWALFFNVPFLCGPICTVAILSYIARHQRYTPGFLLKLSFFMLIMAFITTAFIFSNDGQASMMVFIGMGMQWIGAIAAVGIAIGMS